MWKGIPALRERKFASLDTTRQAGLCGGGRRERQQFRRLEAFWFCAEERYAALLKELAIVLEADMIILVQILTRRGGRR